MNELIREAFSAELEKIALAEGAEKTAATVSSMSRPELVHYKRKLQEEYFSVGGGTSAIGAGIGSAGTAAVLSLISKKKGESRADDVIKNFMKKITFYKNFYNKCRFC